MNDRLSDYATRLRNAYLVGKQELTVPHTKLLEAVSKLLVDEHYLKSFRVEGNAPQKTLILELTYSNRRPALTKIKRISKPGVRIYQKTHNLFPVMNGLGLQILSTSRGLMSDKQARTNKIGGEVLLELW